MSEILYELYFIALGPFLQKITINFQKTLIFRGLETHSTQSFILASYISHTVKL